MPGQSFGMHFRAAGRLLMHRHSRYLLLSAASATAEIEPVWPHACMQSCPLGQGTSQPLVELYLSQLTERQEIVNLLQNTEEARHFVAAIGCPPHPGGCHWCHEVAPKRPSPIRPALLTSRPRPVIAMKLYLPFASIVQRGHQCTRRPTPTPFTGSSRQSKREGDAVMWRCASAAAKSGYRSDQRFPRRACPCFTRPSPRPLGPPRTYGLLSKG